MQSEIAFIWCSLAWKTEWHQLCISVSNVLYLRQDDIGPRPEWYHITDFTHTYVICYGQQPVVECFHNYNNIIHFIKSEDFLISGDFCQMMIMHVMEYTCICQLLWSAASSWMVSSSWCGRTLIWSSLMYVLHDNGWHLLNMYHT